jgi:hypothetical protein
MDQDYYTEEAPACHATKERVGLPSRAPSPDEFRVSGNGAFSAHDYNGAIKMYTRGIKLCPPRTKSSSFSKEGSATLSACPPGAADPVLKVLLSNRSASFLQLSQQYRTTPAKSSECSPYFGMDPSILADMALKGAQSPSSHAVLPFLKC